MNSNEPKLLNLFFRAERYYIQGSLMISEAYNVMEGELKEALNSESVVLKEVGFRSFLDTSAGVCLASKATPEQLNEALGYIDFGTQVDPKLKKRVLFIPLTEKSAPRHQDSPKVISDFNSSSEIEFSCDFTPTPDNLVDGFFRSVIEITKKSHAEAFPGCSDILFIGLRKWSLPISEASTLNQQGKHQIKIGSCLEKDGRGMTVSRLITTLESGAVFKGAVTFSFRKAT